MVDRQPPPALRDDRLDLDTLGAMARTFDQISREDGRTWPATDFVRWLRDEYHAAAEPARTAGRLPIDEAA